MNSLKPGKVYYSRRQRPLSLLHRYSRSRRNKRALEIVGQWWNEKREKRKKERKGKRREEKKINKERKKGVVHSRQRRLYFCRFHTSFGLFSTRPMRLYPDKQSDINFHQMRKLHRISNRPPPSLFVYLRGRCFYKLQCVRKDFSRVFFFFFLTT